MTRSRRATTDSALYVIFIKRDNYEIPVSLLRRHRRDDRVKCVVRVAGEDRAVSGRELGALGEVVEGGLVGAGGAP
jgi:hypothetical protein